LSTALCLCACLQAQQNVQHPSAAPKTAYYVDVVALRGGVILPAPPATGSAENKAELAKLHKIEETRTPEQAARAKADESEEDIFIFKTILGSGFTPEALPITAALGAHVKNEEGVVGIELKHMFQEPRPYQTDSTLHPVCVLKTAHDSYPSGHALVGYLEAFTLAKLVPEKQSEILERADDYALNRQVCGVHYSVDTEASRRVAYAVFGYMLGTPKFQHDLAAAQAEMQAWLSSTKK